MWRVPRETLDSYVSARRESLDEELLRLSHNATEHDLVLEGEGIANRSHRGDLEQVCRHVRVGGVYITEPFGGPYDVREQRGERATHEMPVMPAGKATELSRENLGDLAVLEAVLDERVDQTIDDLLVADDLATHVLLRKYLFGDGGEAIHEAGLELLGEGEEDGVLGREVEVHRPGSDIGAFGDRVNSGRLETAIAKQLECGVKYFATPLIRRLCGARASPYLFQRAGCVGEPLGSCGIPSRHAGEPYHRLTTE